MVNAKFSPLFIGGAGRSGTTLLVDLFGMHPFLSPIYETHFVIVLFQIFYSPSSSLSWSDRKQAYRQYVVEWSEPLPYLPHAKRAYERYIHGPHYIRFNREQMIQLTDEFLAQITSEDLDRQVASYLKNLFELHAWMDGKPSWINKTPLFVQIPHVLLRWFPNMKFIHIVRDGRDAALSVLTRPWGPTNPEDAATWWRDNVASGIQFGEKHPEAYIQIRFEDLVTKPTKTVAEVLSRIAESAGDHYAVAEDMVHQTVPLNQSMSGKWKNHHDRAAIEKIERIADPWLVRLGFK